MSPEKVPIKIGRLAPSPTGPQHVGNARTYLLTWLSIRLSGGQLVMRMEDLDSSRVRRPAIDQAIEDLKWLGLDWDWGPGGNRSENAVDLMNEWGPGPSAELQSVSPQAMASWYQSERSPIYDHFFQQLQLQKTVYPCTCSRTDIQLASSAPNLGDEGPVYPGTCRQQTLPIDQPHAWRFRVRDRTASFHDLVMGQQQCHLATELGDFIVARKSGEFAYQLAVTIDDHLMGINQVIRGDDLVLSTFRQQEIFGCLGWPFPEYAHVPLVFGSDGRRLAKRHGSIRIAQFRQRDRRPEKLVGILAHSCGLIDSPAPISTRQLLQHCQGIDLWQALPKAALQTTDETWKGPVS